MNIYFYHPWVFVLLFPLGYLLWYLISKRNKRSVFFSGYEELKKVYKNDSWYYRFQMACISISLVLFVLLLASPYQKFTQETVERNGIDIEILFDVSYSMTATDLKPSRLEIAKKVFSDFVNGLTSDRVGMIVFAGKPFTSFPLTFDYHFIQQFLQNLTIDIIDQSMYGLQGTAIGDAMVLGEAGFKDTKRNKIIILLTDGEANRGLNPLSAIKFLKDKNIKVYTIGVGGTEKTFVTATDSFGNVQKLEVGGVDEATLKEIALETGGKYYRATSSEVLTQIMDEIGKLEKTKIEEKKIAFEKSYSTPFVLVLFFVLLGVCWLYVRRVKI